MRLDFFKSKMEIFDYTIVVVSWSLDIVFFEHDEHTANLLIFLRMWRLVRIIHAIAVSMRAPVEHQLDQEKYAHRITEARLDKLFDYTKDLETEIKDLRELLRNFVETLPSTKHRKIATLSIERKVKWYIVRDDDCRNLNVQCASKFYIKILWKKPSTRRALVCCSS